VTCSACGGSGKVPSTHYRAQGNPDPTKPFAPRQALGHSKLEVAQALRMLAAEQDKEQQGLLPKR
jgi:hypothetical protein